jgi:hypothetical protein
VDPLYHQTTAQFDEGGAKGLLLYNLGVYGSCRVLFDSFEAPDKCILSDMQTEKSEMIDLSFAKGNISCFSVLTSVYSLCILFTTGLQKILLLVRAI